MNHDAHTLCVTYTFCQGGNQNTNVPHRLPDSTVTTSVSTESVREQSMGHNVHTLCMTNAFPQRENANKNTPMGLPDSELTMILTCAGFLCPTNLGHDVHILREVDDHLAGAVPTTLIGIEVGDMSLIWVMQKIKFCITPISNTTFMTYES